MSTVTSTVERITLEVDGMTCGSCERRIRKELDRVPGYRDARVDLALGRVDVSYESGAATADALVAAVARAGYPAEAVPASTEAPPSGAKSCGCCAPRSS